MKLLCCLLLCLPLKHLSLTSPFGYRLHPVTGKYAYHAGIDLRARHDTVFAITNGIARIGYNDRLGINIKVIDSTLTCIYGHLSQILVGEEHVEAGSPIAITGATGRVTGEHLHLSIQYKGRYLDPLKFLYQLMIKNHE